MRLAEAVVQGESEWPGPGEVEDEAGIAIYSCNMRIRAYSESAQMSSSIGAKAFTQGKDIFFAKGQFNPGTREGDRLLAHELAHTVQGGVLCGEKWMEVEQ